MIAPNTSFSKCAKKKSNTAHKKKPSSPSILKTIDGRIVILELHPIAYDELLRQFRTGFYGKNISETAEILLCEHLLWLSLQP